MNVLPPEFPGMSVPERVKLARQLLDSIPTDDTSLTEAQTADLRQRIAEFERDPDEGQDWEEFKAELERES